jgi:hypothetical protein
MLGSIVLILLYFGITIGNHRKQKHKSGMQQIVRPAPLVCFLNIKKVIKPTNGTLIAPNWKSSFHINPEFLPKQINESR